MKNKLSLLLLAVCLVALGGCTNADNARRTMSDTNVTIYSADSKPIKTWTSDGRVLSEGQSGGWYFKDKATGKLVVIDGGAVIMEEK